MSFGFVRLKQFQFNFKHMRAVKWSPYYNPMAHITGAKEREAIITRYVIAESEEGLCVVLLDSKKRVKLPISSFLSEDETKEVLDAWADWVFERDVLRR